MRKVKLGLIASGSGTDADAIMTAYDQGRIANAEPVLLISTKPDEEIKENFGLIKSYCARFARKINDCAIGPEDLWQEGAIAYWQGKKNYDSQRGIKYSTYIRPRVLRDVRDFLYRFNRTFTFEISMARNISLFFYAKKKLYKILGREPTNEEVRKKMGWGEERLEKTLAALEIVFRSSSLPLNQVAGKDSEKGRKFEEILIFEQGLTAEKKMINLELSLGLVSILNNLSPSKKLCLTESIINEMGNPEIAKDMGLTPERVCQLINKAMWEIRNSPKLARLAEFNGQTECFGVLLNIRGEASLSQDVKNQIRGILLSDDSWPEFYGHRNDFGKLECLELYFGFKEKFYSLEEVGRKLYKHWRRLSTRRVSLQLLQDALDKLPSPLKKKIVAAIKNGNE